MADFIPELQAVADKLEQAGDMQGANTVRGAIDKLQASEHEMERLLVDIDVLQEKLSGQRVA